MQTLRSTLYRLCVFGTVFVVSSVYAQEKSESRIYENRLIKLDPPHAILADYPEYFEPIVEENHFEAPAIIADEDADLEVRAWRFSYNARGIIEIPNRLKASRTAIIMVHPWAIDDEWGWRTPEPNGVADFCTPKKNALAAKHSKEVVNPFIHRLRGLVPLVMFSLPGPADPIRTKVYRSFKKIPSDQERRLGIDELRAKLAAFDYRGKPIPNEFRLGSEHPVGDYFRQFPGLDSSDRFNGAGFWSLPIPVSTSIDVAPEDVVIFDEEGYGPLRDFLNQQKIQHILLVGYATDMCYCRTTAGYENLSKDFNVFLVADASLATFPSKSSPRFAVNASIPYAALNQLITQVSWVQIRPTSGGQR